MPEWKLKDCMRLLCAKGNGASAPCVKENSGAISESPKAPIDKTASSVDQKSKEDKSI